jgi:putative SOS response-associated peptidase YedK
MCGRFVQRYTWDDIQDLYDLPDGPARNLQAHYNVAPTDVGQRREAGSRRLH